MQYGRPALAEQVAAIYTGGTTPIRELAEPTERPTVAWKAGEMLPLAGSYWSEELFGVWQFAQRDGNLWLQSDGPDITVIPAGDGLYTAGGFEIKSARDASGQVNGFEASAGRARELDSSGAGVPARGHISFAGILARCGAGSFSSRSLPFPLRPMTAGLK